MESRNKNLSESNPMFRLFVQYFKQLSTINRTLTEEEYRDYVEDPAYGEEFEHYRSIGDKIFSVYWNAQRHNRGKLGLGESPTDQASMLEYLLEDMKSARKRKGAKGVRAYSEEFTVRMINISLSLRGKS